MVKRQFNRTFSLDDDTDQKLRRLAADQGVSQSDMIRRCVDATSMLITAVEALAPLQADPARYRRVVVLPDHYVLPPGLPSTVLVPNPTNRRTLDGRVQLVAFDGRAVTTTDGAA